MAILRTYGHKMRHNFYWQSLMILKTTNTSNKHDYIILKYSY